jgi:hypothetical protein
LHSAERAGIKCVVDHRFISVEIYDGVKELGTTERQTKRDKGAHKVCSFPRYYISVIGVGHHGPLVLVPCLLRRSRNAERGS